METRDLRLCKQQTANVWERERYWDILLQYTDQAVFLTDQELTGLENSTAAEVLAATVFIAGCKDPYRVAVAQLTTFVAALRCKELFGHRSMESLAARLQPCANFPGGNRKVIEAGMILLQLISLNDHEYDLTADIDKGKQNPLILELDYNVEKERLLAQWDEIPGYIKDAFGNLYSRSVMAVFWI
jgi:hypothetical protein